MMSNETTENFLTVMATFEWPESKTPTYRLYYKDDGSPECYSMDDLPGKYVEVDAETFALRNLNVRVIENKLVHVQPSISVQKLKPGCADGVSCDPRDICFVVNKTQAHVLWNKITNEIS